ncbi:MAG TPA: diguanylate cyclase [Marinobacterium sp.]|nr:diguanylate cyclase [Marinobacterium sp.]
MTSIPYFLHRIRTIVLFSCFCFVQLAQASDDLLVLFSGSAAHPFNQKLLESMLIANEQTTDPLHLEVHYTGNRFNGEYTPLWDRYYQALENFHTENGWRAVVVSWPDDLKFALRYYPDIPIINLSPHVYNGEAKVINLGQEFDQRVSETLKWLRDSYPERTSLHLILGSRSIDHFAAQQILKVSKALGYSPPDLMISRNPEELERRVERMDESSLVIYLPLLSDENGEPLISRDVLQQLAAVSNVPIVSLLKSYVEAGAIGGYVGIVDRYGEAAIGVAQRLAGPTELSVPPTTSGWVFNQLQLERYGMKLPVNGDSRFSGSLVVNQPAPLFSEKGWAILVTLCLSALILVSLILVWNRREIKAHRTIVALNQNLKHKNEELVETNYDLEEALYNASLHELVAETRTAQLQLAMRLASVALFEIDYHSLRARRSGESQWHPLLQLVAEGLQDSHQIEQILALHQRPYTGIDIECWGGDSNVSSNRRVYRLTLSEPSENEEGQEVFYLVRQEISAMRDVQQRLAVEAEERKIYQLQVEQMRENLKRFKLENQKLSELAKDADRDPLTGCLNRRGWERLAGLEFARLKRQITGATSTLLMLDLDFFKRINDTHGHIAGDKVLQDFVTTLQRELRGSDLLGRFGGEEFLILLPDTDSHEAGQFADRLRLMASKMPTDFGARLTVSIGVAAYDVELESMQHWIEVADGALYLAKTKGRDRVQVA